MATDMAMADAGADTRDTLPIITDPPTFIGPCTGMPRIIARAFGAGVVEAGATAAGVVEAGATEAGVVEAGATGAGGGAGSDQAIKAEHEVSHLIGCGIHAAIGRRVRSAVLAAPGTPLVSAR